MLDQELEPIVAPEQDPGDGITPEMREADSALRLQSFGNKLETLFKEQVTEKALIEERWLMDLRQYNGEYDDETIASIRAAGGSEAFVNFTRVKCNSVEARESEMVLPTDDRNWAIEPTAVPEMKKALKSRKLAKGPDGKPIVVDGKPQTVADQLAEVLKEAKEAAALMQEEMDDQLEEADFNGKQRNVIHNKVVLGSGILKGPIIANRISRKYKQRPVTDSNGITTNVWSEDIAEDLSPGVESVSPWDFFPDMRATSMTDCEFTFERHRFNRQGLSELAKLPGFLKSQVEAAIEAGPAAAMSGLIDQAVSADLRSRRANGRFEVIEYQGPIDRDDLIAAGVPGIDPADKLSQHYGTVWICNGIVMKAVLSMMDDGKPMYDVVPFERDDTSIFGYGVPYRMRHSQAAGNSSWRMILDNARLSVGPQVVYKRGKVVPTNGDKRLAPLKTWEVIDPNMDVSEAFAVFAIAPNFTSMFDILKTVREFGDEETGMPMIAQGQQAPSITKTAEGMSLLMNSANVVLRRLVKEYDDCITRRFIRRLYDWNMRFNEREEIKGDYMVNALGSAALMLQEQQTRGLMQLVQLAGMNPKFAERTKWSDLYRKLVRSMKISADELVMTDEEFEVEAEKQSKQQPQLPPEIQVKMAQLDLAKAKLELDKQVAQATLQLKGAEVNLQAKKEAANDDIERQRISAQLEEAHMAHDAAMAGAQAQYQRISTDHDIAVMRLVEQRRITMDVARNQYGLKAMEIDSKHQLFNSEMAHANATGHGI
jgi:hypothetical protein